jgi:hypothetical protein
MDDDRLDAVQADEFRATKPYPWTPKSCSPSTRLFGVKRSYCQQSHDRCS